MTGSRQAAGRTGTMLFNLAIFSFCIYLLTSAGNIVYNADQSLVRFEVTRGIVERFDVSVPAEHGIRGRDGRDYSWYGIGASLLALPLYMAGSSSGAPEEAFSLMPQLFSAATVALIFAFCVSIGYSRRASLYTALCYGFGTFAWPLSKQPFDHTIETFFILLSVFFMHRHLAAGSFTAIIFSAWSLGAAFLTREVSILALLPLLLMVASRHGVSLHGEGALRQGLGKGIVFFVMMSPFLAVSLWYNHYRFGSPLETGFSVMAARLGIDFFTGTPLLTGLRGFLVSPGKGFFFYSPVAFLFFFCVRPFMKRHRGLAVCFIGIMVSYLLFLSKNLYWHGDFAWGPRYLLPLTPLFIIPLAEVFDSPGWREGGYLRSLAVFLLAAGIAIQVAAVSVSFQRYFSDFGLDRKIVFTTVGSSETPYIREPVPETYFDWRLSPISAQFGFLAETARGIGGAGGRELPNGGPSEAGAGASPDSDARVLDFFWMRASFREGNFGLLAVPCLLGAAAFSFRRLYEALSRNPEREVRRKEHGGLCP